MGEEVIAVIQPANMADATEAFRDELIAYAREKLSGVKIPRRIDFAEALPRHDTGKLYKRLLRDQYWEKAKAEARSEEQKSELQSLMRNSYAVFCLKTKKKSKN